MTYLMDTHTFIWSILDTSKLSDIALKIIADKTNIGFVSIISFWEISLKASIKKDFFVGVDVHDLPKLAKQLEFQVLDMKEKETCAFVDLPLKNNHKDPFDRMLIWQAITSGMALISRDAMFEQYKEDGLQLVW